MSAVTIQTIASIVSASVILLIGWVFRGIGKRIGQFFDQHHWLMETTKQNTDEIKKIVQHIERVQKNGSV